ncbi:esterase-like activity of phytase family protein [Cellulomonas sp.]|uniref:esterase-like activity of phytase family protein n=1 Tax=Cellulomonas sp. TaxID=40001 RepID=UPI00258452E5|nr:esterase-like activity of phytase family protein [Cellulomonas sp.]MCR6688475.1 esterase-like activity of phytase family protein [Cellulomonas sp.]
MLPARPRRAPVRAPRRAAAPAVAVTVALAAAGLTCAPAVAAAPPAPGWSDAGWTAPAADAAFHRLATYPVYLNRPAGTDAADPTVAEISAVSEDGTTFVHTDALARRIGFVDITDPAHPVGAGTLDLAADLGVGAHAEPTSVAVVGGYVLVVVDTSASFTEPSGALVIVDLATHQVVRTLDLPGQPDSIALTPDKRNAAIAIENQRDEDATPAGADEGDLPQLPGGSLVLVDLPDVAAPADWSLRTVPFTAGDEALPSFVAAGLDTPQDPEPEYVAVDPTGTTVAVTLQENNGVVLVDVTSGAITDVFSAGTQAVTGIDTVKDGVISQTGAIPAVPREPDAIGWLDATHVAIANEGDWKGGTRGWSVLDTTTGAVVWDAGAELERLAVRVGLHTEDRAAKKGVEIEGLAVATLGGTPYAFVGSERSNFVAVYDVSDPVHPVFTQVLATTNGPEGILPVPGRDLLLVSSETDAASAGVRSAVTVFGRGAEHAGGADFPSVVSADAAGAPIGWGALGALAADRRDDERLWSATDAAYKDTRLLSIDVSSTPAVIDRQLRVTEGGTGVTLDVEGVATRAGGGFWLGVEGATGGANQIVRTNAYGAVVERVSLPADVAAGLTKWGIEGVTTLDDAAGEHVWVALQRGLTTDPGGLGGAARLGRYDVATGAWSWFAYPLETTATAGDWIGLSEVVAVDADTLAVIERDKLNGPNAAVKRVYTVDVPASDPAPGTVGTLTKTLARDVLPDLRATAGWTQEKLEGLTIAGDGTVWAITDNDALADATGETVLLDLGTRSTVFGARTTSTDLTVTGSLRYGERQTLTATVTPATAGTVTFRDGERTIATAPVAAGSSAGTATAEVTLGAGTHRLTAELTPSGTDVAGSSSSTVTVTVTRAVTRTTTTLVAARVAYGTPAKVKVAVTGTTAAPSGRVEVREGTRVLGTATLLVSGTRGTATVTLPARLAVGSHRLTAVWAGTTHVAGSSSSTTLQVAKATPRISLAAASWTVAKGSRPAVVVRVSGAGATPTGTVVVRVGATTVAKRVLRDGTVVVTLPAAQRTARVTATYLGGPSYRSATTARTLTVR